MTFRVVLLILNLFIIIKNSNTIDRCNRCKLLSDSFNHWFQKTTRGKFEGGNAAWEESNLKNYANSEIRLAEIQENLCSEVKNHQDICYAIAEEAELVIEKWWLNQVGGLYTYLCIESLKYCCPKNHFGVNCESCPSEAGSSHVCSGNGKCDGDGTRQGNGLCKCHVGYNGTVCEKCAKSFYKVDTGLCKSCHMTCDECIGAEVDKCTACKKGWKLKDNICVDIDECTETEACDSNEYCVNKFGSFLCEQCDMTCLSCAGAGEYNCIVCAPDHFQWNGLCVDHILKNNLIEGIFKNIALYLAFLIIVCCIFKYSKTLASVALVLVSILIYYFELQSKISIINVIFNYVK